MNSLTISGPTLIAAHVVHYTVLVAGLAGLFYLLAPGGLPTRRAAGSVDRPRDEHQARVQMLRAELEGRSPIAAPSHRSASAARDHRWQQVAVAASLVAAIIHAAVCPEHFQERFLFGAFFAVCAAAQVTWAFVAMRRPSLSWWVAGSVGNFVVVALWTVTRVEGLPFGLLPTPEEVGPWDTLASLAEMVVVVAAALLVRRHRHSSPVQERPRQTLKAQP